MKLWTDSANAGVINEAKASCVVSGVTTNPALVAKEPPHPGGYNAFLRQLVLDAGLQDMHFSVQPPIEVLRAAPRETCAVLKGGLQARGLIIKIPVAYENMHLIRAVAAMGLPVNATCIFTIEQGIAAINAGARYVSVFWCRVNESGGDAQNVVDTLRRLIDKIGSRCEIIAGSIRTPEDASYAFECGAHIVTAGLPVLKGMCESELSRTSSEGFEKACQDWIARGEELSTDG